MRDFRAALEGPGPIQLIAEVKKASPSARVIRADFDPVAIARIYQEHGAACLSILTDAPYSRAICHISRESGPRRQSRSAKDFLIDDYQVVEAVRRRHAILLIAEILDERGWTGWGTGAALGMAALVEFHDPANLPRVLASGADLIGINNRDLNTFVTDLEQTLRLRDRIPPRSCSSARAASATGPTSSGSRPPGSRPSWSANP